MVRKATAVRDFDHEMFDRRSNMREEPRNERNTIQRVHSGHLSNVEGMHPDIEVFGHPWVPHVSAHCKRQGVKQRKPEWTTEHRQIARGLGRVMTKQTVEYGSAVGGGLEPIEEVYHIVCIADVQRVEL